jgi:replication-associated recombination protein RarA
MADGDGRAVLTLAEEVWRAAREGELFDTEALVKWSSAARRSMTRARMATTI